MFYVIRDGDHLTVATQSNDGNLETCLRYTSLYTPTALDMLNEMVAVLNRDLENRANDIAATPENIATSHLEHTYCDNPACECNRGYPVHGTTSSVQEEPPEMPNASDDCGNPSCPACNPGGETDARLMGNAMIEHESALRKVVPEDEVRSIKPENYAGVGDGPDVDIAMDQTGLPTADDDIFHPTDEDLGLEDVGP